MDLRSAKIAACNASVQVAITFHYRESRLRFLGQVLQCLSGFPVKYLEVVVLTNTNEPREIALISDLLETSRLQGLVVKSPPLEDPQHLTWQHKYLIENFAKEESAFTHFIYLEDDEMFTFENLLYFLKASGDLHEYGLVPGFCRCEISKAEKVLVALDAFKPSNLSRRSYASVGEDTYLHLDNFYCGCFVLDKAMAEEYVKSISFDMIGSADLSRWNVSERAAAGLTFENIPFGFKSRAVIALSPGKNIIDDACYLGIFLTITLIILHRSTEKYL